MHPLLRGYISSPVFLSLSPPPLPSRRTPTSCAYLHRDALIDMQILGNGGRLQAGLASELNEYSSKPRNYLRVLLVVRPPINAVTWLIFRVIDRRDLWLEDDWYSGGEKYGLIERERRDDDIACGIRSCAC